MNRDLNEVLISQQKMLGKNEDVFSVKLYNQFQKLLANVESFNKKEPGVEILYIDYKETLNNSEAVIDKIEQFIGVQLKKEEMSRVIDKSLYRNRLVDKNL